MEEPLLMHRLRSTLSHGLLHRLLALSCALLAGGCTTLAPVQPTLVAVAPAAAPMPEPAPAPEPLAAQPAAAVAEPAPTPNPSPRGRLDPGQDAERLDLWERVRDNYSIPALDGDLVRKWEQFYANQPDYVQRMAERGSRYLFHIVEEVHKEGLPIELALLPFIESAFNPQAMSHAKASGMWQFMPATGKDFDLRQNLFRDDRRNVLSSTRAALAYLKRLHNLFDDWHLALAAYNWGQGNVMRELARNRRAGKALDYASLNMPDETRNYVPKFQAIKNIVASPAAFALSLPPLENHPYFLSVPIARDIDVALVAELAGVTVDEFHQLNPQLNKPVILAAATPQVLLTYDAANRFVSGLAQVKRPLSSWTAWVAPRNLKPAEAAKAVGMSEASLREINQIPDRMIVKVGSTLVVPRTAGSPDSVAEHIADGGQLNLAREGRPLRRVHFKVGHKGDSVAAVARRHRVTPAQIAAWNNLGGKDRLKPGQTLVLMLAEPATRRAATSAARPVKAKSTAQPAKRTAARTAVRPKARTPTRVAQR
jgi:membrane-bound lytic murein transglycosylase D